MKAFAKRGVHMKKSTLSSLKFVAVGTILFSELLALPASVSKAQKTEIQECNVVITSPKPDEKVQSDALVKGTAQIPKGSFLWVLARKEGLTGWWPQGGGPAEIEDGKWKVLVKFGVPNEYGTFEIATAVVDAQRNEDLKKWVEEAPPNYFPTKFPSLVEGCMMKKVVVDKVRN
jgi:hypothetical protein